MLLCKMGGEMKKPDYKGHREREWLLRRQIMTPLTIGLLVSTAVVLALSFDPILDGGRETGGVLQLHHGLLWFFLGTLGLTAAGVFAFLYSFLGRVQAELFARRSALLNEIGTRQQAETALHSLREHLERQVVERTCALQREIDVRWRAEKDARNAWNDLRQIFNASGNGMILLNLGNATIRANNTASLLLGRPLPEIIGRKCHELFACGHFDTPECCIWRIMAGAEQADCEVKVKHNDKRQVWVLLSSAPLCDVAGRIIGIVQNFQDFTRRKQVEAELCQAKEEWEQTFNAMDDIVTLQDQDLRIIRANRAAGKFLEMPVDSLVGRYCYELFRGTTDPCPGCPELLSLYNRRPHTSEIYHPGMGKTLQVSALPVLGEDGSCRALIHVARDITAQKEIAAELQHARKIEAIGTLAAGVAHDFNNILTGILGYAQITLLEKTLDSSVRENIAQIIEMGKRGAGLTRQLLAFSRKQTMEMSLVNLNELVENLMKMFSRLLGEDIEIRFDLAPDLGLVTADAGQMEQALLNLVINARDAMPTGGSITIETLNIEFDAEQSIHHPDMTYGPHMMLTVSDTGIGMDQETREHIFEPFFTTKEVGQGTGLGLASVHGIVRQHHGSIWVYSEPGQGSVFEIFLPLASGQPAPAKASSVSIPGQPFFAVRKPFTTVKIAKVVHLDPDD